jgi:7-carboxy-7-deazaguanine synthase
MNSHLTITEIFASIQGESTFAGHPCTFVRLTGCPLRCSWCDTVYGYKGGKRFTFDEILAAVSALGLRTVELTGGEPLAQEGTGHLAHLLLERGYRVLIETSGALPINVLPQEVHVVMDLKCPASGMADRNHWANIDYLKPTDEIKFVVASSEDLAWARMIIGDYDLATRFQVSVSPAWGLIEPKVVSQWIIDSKLPIRLNLQLHKYIWGPDVQGV